MLEQTAASSLGVYVPAHPTATISPHQHPNGQKSVNTLSEGRSSDAIYMPEHLSVTNSSELPFHFACNRTFAWFPLAHPVPATTLAPTQLRLAAFARLQEKRSESATSPHLYPSNKDVPVSFLLPSLNPRHAAAVIKSGRQEG